MGSPKVFLRHDKTGRWYAGPDRWVDETGAAHEFGTVEEAIRFGKGMGLEGLVVVLRYDQPDCDLVLPL